MATDPQFAQYQYVTPDGAFDYEQYVASQSDANVRKLSRKWVMARTIDTICRYLRQRIPAPKFGLCHGTRGGYEQVLFHQHLPGCTVLGTEISPTATQFPDTIQWDFHEIKPEWNSAADFVYSNSLDHAYDPQLAVDRWMQEVAEPGYCFIEWWGSHTPLPVPVDCFSASVDGCGNLLREWGKVSDVRYGIVDTLTRIRSRRRGLQGGRDGIVFVLAKDVL